MSHTVALMLTLRGFRGCIIAMQEVLPYETNEIAVTVDSGGATVSTGIWSHSDKRDAKVS